jgi:hypothetical protein
VVTELLINFFDARWDRAITDCEADTALVLTADVTVLVVGAGQRSSQASTRYSDPLSVVTL